MAGPIQDDNRVISPAQQQDRGGNLNTSLGLSATNDFRREQLLAGRGGAEGATPQDPFTNPIPVPVTINNGQASRVENITAQEVFNRSATLAIEARTNKVTNPNYVPNTDKQINELISSLPGKVAPEQNPADYKMLNDMVARIDPAGKYNVIIQNDNKINAFAAGNTIVITTGMLAETRNNENALLGVVCHEIGHCKSGHSYLPMGGAEPTATSSRQEVIDYLAKLHLRGTAELEADIYSGNRMREMGVPTEPLRALLVSTFGKDDALIDATTDQYAKYMPRDQAKLLNDITTPYPKVQTREQQIAPGERSVVPPKVD